MARTLIASDSFVGTADTTLDSGSWSQLYSFWGNMRYGASNTFYGSAGSISNMSAARWNGSGSFSDDQYSSAVISGGLSFGACIGVIARASADTDSNRDFYFFRFTSAGGTPTNTTELGKIVNGTVTVLVTSTSPSWTAGDRIEIECEGTTIRGLKNGTLVSSFSVTDSDLTSGKPGICGYQAANEPYGDSWEGGDVTASSFTPRGTLLGVG